MALIKKKKKPGAISGLSLAARAIHAGENRRKYADSITTPIVQTATFTFANSKDIEEYTKKGKEHF